MHLQKCFLQHVWRIGLRREPARQTKDAGLKPSDNRFEGGVISRRSSRRE